MNDPRYAYQELNLVPPAAVPSSRVRSCPLAPHSNSPLIGQWISRTASSIRFLLKGCPCRSRSRRSTTSKQTPPVQKIQGDKQRARCRHQASPEPRRRKDRLPKRGSAVTSWRSRVVGLADFHASRSFSSGCIDSRRCRNP